MSGTPAQGETDGNAESRCRFSLIRFFLTFGARGTRAIIQLASQYGPYGYRRITVLLQRAGWNVGRDYDPASLQERSAPQQLETLSGSMSIAASALRYNPQHERTRNSCRTS